MSEHETQSMTNEQPAEDKDQLISLAEAAKRCGLSHSTLRRYAWEGKLKARKVGRDWLTTMANVEEYLASRQRKRQGT